MGKWTESMQVAASAAAAARIRLEEQRRNRRLAASATIEALRARAEEKKRGALLDAAGERLGGYFDSAPVSGGIGFLVRDSQPAIVAMLLLPAGPGTEGMLPFRITPGDVVYALRESDRHFALTPTELRAALPPLVRRGSRGDSFTGEFDMESLTRFADALDAARSRADDAREVADRAALLEAGLDYPPMEDFTQ